MTTFHMEVPDGPESTGLATGPQLRAALVSADENLRRMVIEGVQASGLPISVGIEVTAPPPFLDPEHLEHIRVSEPHVVIVDMSDDPIGAIRATSAIASGNPGAAIIGVGPELESSCLLDAVRAGMVEYVPRPVEAPSIADALERVLKKHGWAEASGSHRDGELHAFFSAKGGSGSTSVITNVGIELHRLTGKRTLLVDLDLELGEIASHLGVEPRFHFVDLVRNLHRMDADLLDSYIESHESGVHVLSAPFEPEIGEGVTGDQIARTLGFLRSHFDYVLVDTSKSLAPPALAALQAADLIFLVTNIDVPSLRNLKRCLPVLDRVTDGNGERLRLVVNRFNPKSLVRVQDLEETLGLEVYSILTNDFGTVIEAISTGRPLVMQSKSRYAEQLKALGRSIVEGPGARNGARKSLVGRFLSPFRSRSSRTHPSPRSPKMEVTTHG